MGSRSGHRSTVTGIGFGDRSVGRVMVIGRSVGSSSVDGSSVRSVGGWADDAREKSGASPA